jgi:hypothetical protein
MKAPTAFVREDLEQPPTNIFQYIYIPTNTIYQFRCQRQSSKSSRTFRQYANKLSNKENTCEHISSGLSILN